MKTPVMLVTGFLGSGKTTLISALLRHPELGETAVIVNELGEIGIDHHLLRRVVEPTGLADPAPIVFTLLSEPVVKHHFELDGVITTVDAVHGLRHDESVKQ